MKLKFKKNNKSVKWQNSFHGWLLQALFDFDDFVVSKIVEELKIGFHFWLGLLELYVNALQVIVKILGQNLVFSVYRGRLNTDPLLNWKFKNMSVRLLADK